METFTLRTNARRRARSRGLLVLGAVVASLMAMALPASAVNTVNVTYGSNPCPDRSQADWSFSSDSEWNEADDAGVSFTTLFESGFNNWRYDVESWSGGYLLSRGGTSFDARWSDLGATTAAKTTCIWPVYRIEFNTQRLNDYRSGSLSLEGVSAHEWGHAFGLGHVGFKDTAWGLNAQRPPTMATCLAASFSDDKESLSHDDDAAIIAQNEIVGGYHTVTANSSFEENESSGIGHWMTQNVDYFARWTSGGGQDGSPSYGVFGGEFSNTAIYADTKINWAQGGYLKARANYKKLATSDYGDVKVTLKYRLYEYSPGDGSCDELNDLASIGSGWTAVNSYCTPASAWDFCTTSLLVVSGGADRVVDARVVVYNRMKDENGRWTSVRVDRVRVMADGASI